MRISEETAANIVTELNEIIGQRLNVMNTAGIIIASSDPKRIGTFHAASFRLIQEKLKEIVIRSDAEYEGCRQGINLPITVNNEVVGVIGVTGAYDEAAHYGQIVKKLTEILLKDAFYKEQGNIEKRIRERFLGEWLYGTETIPSMEFAEYGRTLGIDIDKKYRIFSVAVILKDAQYRMVGHDVSQRIFDGINTVIRILVMHEQKGFVFSAPNTIICGVPYRPDKNVKELAELIKLEIELRYNVSVTIGIDSYVAGDGVYTVHAALQQSTKALYTGLRLHNSLCFYGDINIEIFSTEVTDASKKEYVRRIFKNYPVEELPALISLLDTFYAHDGSLTLAAEALRMHKNTVQYKLKKIAETTGFDPRRIKNAPLFYIAIHFFYELKCKF